MSESIDQNPLPSVDPTTVGLDATQLAEAIELAESSETNWPRELDTALNSDPDNQEPPPFNEVIGPTRNRGGPNGLVLRRGAIAARFGETKRVDLTFSATKTYLALLFGIALEDGLVQSLDAPCRDSALDDGFDSDQNKTITWRQLLQQTSEWEGTLWSKPDSIDRHRQIGPGADNSRKGEFRELATPGTFWEYNDVRVNRLSLSLLQLFRRPLPTILKQRIMQPIGATDTWEWHGYRNSFVTIDDEKMQSVPGGAHWGGGLFISSEDHALVGELMRNRGRFNKTQVINKTWFDSMLEPCALNPIYGCLTWLNTDGGLFPTLASSSYLMLGAGQNIVFVDPEKELVCVLRWVDSTKVESILSVIVNACR